MNYDPKKIEELQLVLLKNPRSPLFASLAEAYRQMGLLEEALEVTTEGLRHNPEYVSGLVAHAKVLFELKDYRQAVHILKKAHGLKPENILAMRLLGHSFLKLQEQDQALKVFKKLLVLQPQDQKVAQIVQKWEFLESLLPLASTREMSIEGYEHWIQKLPTEAHVAQLIDSFINQENRHMALEIAHLALTHWPQSSELQRRHDLLNSQEGPRPLDGEPSIPLKSLAPQGEEKGSSMERLKHRKAFYEAWLQRVEQMTSLDSPG